MIPLTPELKFKLYFSLLRTMEGSSLRKYNSNLHVQNVEIIASCIECKLDKLEVLGPFDAKMNENELETQFKTTTQSPQPAPLLRQNSIGLTMIDNKENLEHKIESTSSGGSQPAQNTYFPSQPNEHLDDTRNVDPYVTNACPPMMFYSNSLSFSDTSMPFPSLTTSKSFGPSGILYCNNNHNNSAAPTTQFFRHQSSGPKVCNPSISQLHTPDNMYTYNVLNAQSDHEKSLKHSCNDQAAVSIAACALLDLTPTAAHSDRFHRTRPQMNEGYLSNEMNQLVCNQQNDVPIFRQNESFDVHINAKYLNLNVPTRARIESRAQDLLTDVSYTLQACKCKNTKCLKLYCACFQQGTFCDELVCYCRKCENTEKHSKARGSRTRAVYEILSRRIDAFEPRERRQTGNGCSCRKSK